MVRLAAGRNTDSATVSAAMPRIAAIIRVVDAGESVIAINGRNPAAESRDHADLLAALGQGDAHLAFRASLCAAAFRFVGVERECGCSCEWQGKSK